MINTVNYYTILIIDSIPRTIHFSVAFISMCVRA